jgi:hypothetical protein
MYAVGSLTGIQTTMTIDRSRLISALALLTIALAAPA